MIEPVQRACRLDTATYIVYIYWRYSSSHYYQYCYHYFILVSLFMASGLGFNIRGGSDANYLRGHPGIFVTSIKPGSSADRDGRLKIGDRLLEVHTTLTSRVRSFEMIRIRICDQINRWIHSGQGFIGSFDLPWSEWSQITDPDPDHPKETHPKTGLEEIEISTSSP